MATTMTSNAVLQAMDEQHSRYMASLRALLESGMASPQFQLDTPTLRPTDSGLNMHDPSLPLLDEQPGPHTRQRPDTESHGSQTAPITQYVKGLLPRYSFTTEDLVQHIQHADTFGSGSQTALDDLVTRRAEMDKDNFFHGTEGNGDASDPYHDASYEIYDINRDGKAEARHGEDGDQRLEVSDVWGPLRAVNTSGEDTVGRITVLAEPSPRMFASLHKALGNQFDMDELLGHLVSGSGNYGKTRAFCTERAFEKADIHQRTFFFIFKYYTVVGEGGEKNAAKSPYPFQKFDRRPAEKKKADHIDIAECSSVVALSFSGDLSKAVSHKYKRRRPIPGKAFSPFSPWHVLLLQTFPDDEHSTRDGNPLSYPCGPLAFLDLLASEYRDAGKRLDRLTQRITALITPPLDFMFDPRLRDGLLFEDVHYTYSRRYFWAYNTLGVINDGIKSMIHTYSQAFSQSFWEGRCDSLFGLPEETDEQIKIEYLAALASARKELDYTIRRLQGIWAQNESVRQEIKSLRDQLFSGSSVKESRRAIEQGDNIKMLTILSMIFLPLSFVASIFGITEFHIPVSDWRFPITMVFVCVPFLLFVLLTQTRTGTELVKNTVGRVRDYFINLSSSANSTAVPLLPTQEPKPGPPASLNEAVGNNTSASPPVVRFAPIQMDQQPPHPGRPRFDRRISRRSVKAGNTNEQTSPLWRLLSKGRQRHGDIEIQRQ